MSMRITKRQTVRYYEIVVNRKKMHRHFAIIQDMLNRRIKMPRVGGSGPETDKPDMFWITFAIPEEFADEYESRMKSRKKNP